MAWFIGVVLFIIGASWSVIGFGNIIGTLSAPSAEGRSTMIAIGLMFNMLVFILPGLVVLGIGTGLAKRASRAKSAAPAMPAVDPPERRLERLATLYQAGTITDDEYHARRAEIVKEL